MPVRPIKSPTSLASASIHLHHLGGLISSTFNFLKWRKGVIIADLIAIINTQTKLHHAENTTCKLRWLIQVEARSEQGCVNQRPYEVLHRLVRFICRCFLLEFSHDRVPWVHLHVVFENM